LESVEVTVKSSELTYDNLGGFWWKVSVDVGPGIHVDALCSKTARGLSMDTVFDEVRANEILAEVDDMDVNAMVLNMIAGLIPEKDLINQDLNPEPAFQ